MNLQDSETIEFKNIRIEGYPPFCSSCYRMRRVEL